MKPGNIAITVDSISKCYRIGLKEDMHDTFAKSIFSFIKSPFKNYRKYRSLYKFDNIDPHADSDSSDILWALRDVSFEVTEGEVLGIIGKNGAGKSTLLKIFSRITHPTRGNVYIRGKSSSLLEVGTGFHPDLTGRENVFLNGTILGMTKKEIVRKFDAIVDFSGVEKFIDTPVKRYSSGMSVRLAFAVAAHLEPEILIVDEVLAVGDAEFQGKCIGKMSSIAKEGRTVLFVSHNMGAVTELCSRVLWLENGSIKMGGDPLEIVTNYLSLNVQEVGFWNGSTAKDCSGKLSCLRHARVFSGDGNNESTIYHFDERINIEIVYEIRNNIRAFKSYILLRDTLSNIIWCSHDTDGTDRVGLVREPGLYHSTCVFPERLLRPGQYYVTIGIVGHPREAVEEEHVDALSFKVSEAGYIFTNDQRKGLITPFLDWQVEHKQSHRDHTKA